MKYFCSLLFIVVVSCESLCAATFVLTTNLTNIVCHTCNNNESGLYAVGPGSKFKFLDEFKVGTKKDAITYVIIQFTEKPKPYVGSSPAFSFAIDDPIVLKALRTADISKVSQSTPNTANQYVIKKDDLIEGAYRVINGFSYGPLSTPFKLHLDSGSEVSLGGNLGVFVGPRFNTVTYIVSFGFTNVTISSVNSDNTEEAWGIYGTVGVIKQVAPKLHVGILIGIDHLGGETGMRYKHEDQLWLAFSSGFAFLK